MKKALLTLLVFAFFALQIYGQDNNFNKLVENLVGVGSPFAVNEAVHIPNFTVRAIDVSQSNGKNVYLVAVNGNSGALKPFYIETTRTFKFMDITPYQNAIAEDVDVKFVRTEQYLNNNVPRDTLLFRETIGER